MHHIGYYFGISKQIEILSLALAGIYFLIIDISIMNLNSDLLKVWDMKIDEDKISSVAQLNLKYFLSGLILIKAWSAHLYLASYLVILWPVFFAERPFLIIPWLTIGAVRIIGTSLVSFLTGLYVCIAHDIFQRPACLDFGLSMFIDYAPSYYMWFLILSFLQELKLLYTSIVSFAPSKTALETEITIRRRKVRSMTDGMYFKHHCPIDEDRHLISVSTIENILKQLTADVQGKTTRSLDSLGAKASDEAEKEELASLGDELPNDEVGLSLKDKTLKLFKLTNADIVSVKRMLRKDGLSTQSLFDFKKGTDKTSLQVTKPLEQSDSFKSIKNKNGSNLMIALEAPKCQTDLISDVSETEIGTILNYSTESVKPVPKQAKVDKYVNQKQTKATTVDFGCQVSTLSRNILNAPPAELLRPVKYIKTISLKEIWGRGSQLPLPDEQSEKSVLLKKGAVSDTPLQTLFKVDGYATEYNENTHREVYDSNLIRLAKNLICPELN